MKWIFLLSSFLICPTVFVGQNLVEYNNLTSLLESYLSAREYEKAIPFAEKAVIAAKNAVGESHIIYANSLNNLANLYQHTRLYEQAETLYLKVLAIDKKNTGGTSAEYATGLNNLGNLYQNLKQYDKAKALYTQSMAIRKKVFGENHQAYATVLRDLADLYEDTGEYQKAEQFLLTAISINKKAEGKSQNYAAMLNDLALLYGLMGKHKKATPIFIEAMDMRGELLGEKHPDYANSLNCLALNYHQLGEYEKAEPLLLKALAIRKEVFGENHIDYTVSLNNLADHYSTRQLCEKAEPLLLRALELRKELLGEKDTYYATSLHNLGILYEKVGQYEKAESYLLKAKEIYKLWAKEDPSSYSNCLNSLGALYEEMELYDKAEALLTESAEIIKSKLKTNSEEYAFALSNLGCLFIEKEEYNKAEPYLLQALEIRKNILGENHPDYATSLNNIAGMYALLGQYNRAEPLLKNALQIVKKKLGENHSDYLSSLNNLVHLYEDMKLFKVAEPLLVESLKQTSKNLVSNFSFFSEQEKQNFLDNKINELGNNFLYNFPTAATATIRTILQSQLSFKGLVLNSTRKMMTALLQNKDTATQSLFQQWQQNKKILAREYSLPVSNQRQDLKQIESIAERQEKQLNRQSSAFRQHLDNIEIDIDDIRKNLGNDEAAIEFVSFEVYDKKTTDTTMYGAYILTKKDSIPLFLPLCKEELLQKLFDSAGKTATAMVSKFYRGGKAEATGSNLGQALYKLIWEPLEPFLKGIRKISYSPAGKLYAIAFHALTVDTTTLLMDKYELTQYTSIREVALRNSANQTTPAQSISLFGNASFSMDSLQIVKSKSNLTKVSPSTSIYKPETRSSSDIMFDSLPGTEREINGIKSLFDQRNIATHIYTKTEASEANLKALEGQSTQIIHIATHGFFLPVPDQKKKEHRLEGNTYSLANDPLLRTGLILAGGNYSWSGNKPIDGVEDGIATAYEISQLNLSNTELVVLSACETALGDVKGSEGVFGLQRSFKLAGVKKMIVSLWQVPDKETAELMTSFYTYWLNGKGIEESFRQAQAEMRKKYSPFYWAAFVVIE